MKALFKKEILDVIRDRRTIINMIIIPVFGIPFLMILMGGIMRKSVKELTQKRYEIGIYEKAKFKELKEILEKTSFKIIKTENPESLLSGKEIDAGVIVDRNNDKFKIEIIYAIDRKTSKFAEKRLKEIISSFKERLFKHKLEEKGVKHEDVIPFIFSERGIEVGKGAFGLVLGTILGYLIVILMVTSSMYPAIDLIAGEKERRTLEILLSSPAGVNKIIISKILVVTLVSFVAAILSILSISITFLKGGGIFFEGAYKISLFKTMNIKEIILIFGIIIPFAFLVSSVEIAITSYARSYKEAQSLLTPLTFIVIIPAFYSFVPGISFSPWHFLIPVLNVAVTIKKIFQGEFVPLEYTITLFSNLLYMISALIYSINIFKKEKVIFRV